MKYIGPTFQVPNVVVQGGKNGDKVTLKQAQKFTRKICGSWNPLLNPDNKRLTSKKSANLIVKFSSNGNVKGKGFMAELCSYNCI